MGWASGSRVYDRIVTVLKQQVPDYKTRVAIHKELIQAFEKHDCDTLDECRDIDPAFDEALGPVSPD